MSTATARASRVRRILRSGYHSARNLPDRILHRRRHQEVTTRLSRAKRPREILVVCYGNVCRSPYLQAVLQRSLPDTPITSAGFFGSDRAVPAVSAALGAKRGLDLSRHRSRPLTAATMGNADLIIAMDSYQARQIRKLFPRSRALVLIAGDLDPAFEATRTITDPWNQSVEVFEAAFDRLDRCAATVVRILQAR
jgi:low molecular weight protein-tyrosine phosphatase